MQWMQQFEEAILDVAVDISRHTNANDIELKTTLQQLLLNLVGDAVETDVVFGEDALHLLRVHRGRHCGWCFPSIALFRYR